MFRQFENQVQAEFGSHSETFTEVECGVFISLADLHSSLLQSAETFGKKRQKPSIVTDFSLISEVT